MGLKGLHMSFTLVGFYDTYWDEADDVVFAPHDENHEEECRINSSMMRNLASALNTLAPHLKSIVYSGGTRVPRLLTHLMHR
jgi:hypothetical protein